MPITGGTVNGDLIVQKSGLKGYIKLWTDNEGGNFKIVSKSGNYGYEFDAYADNFLRIHTYTHKPDGFDGHQWLFNSTNGIIGGVGTPTASDHAANKAYADTKNPLIDIGTFTGDISDTAALHGCSTAWITPNTVNNPTGDYGYLENWGFGGPNRLQRFTRYSNHAVLTRQFVNNAWTLWEYDNPPLGAGVEYPTTERFDGRVVYCKRVDCGTPPSNGKKAVTYSQQYVYPIRYSATLHDIMLPYIDDDLYIRVYCVTNSQIGIEDRTGGAFTSSGQHVVATIWYVYP